MKRIKLWGCVCAILLNLSCQSNRSNKASTNSFRTETAENTAKEAKTFDLLSIREDQLKAIDATLGYIEKKDLKNGLQAVGFVRVHNQDKASISSLYGGKIQSLYISPGSVVKKGQLIATLLNPEIIVLQEEYLTLKNSIELTKIELNRQEELMRGNAGALKNYQNIKAQLAQQQIRLASIRKQLSLAGIDAPKLSVENIRESLSVTAPMAGTVASVEMGLGASADAGMIIARIVNNEEVDLDLYVYEKDLEKVKIGQEITFSLSNNPNKEGKAIVDKVGSSFEGENKAVAVHARIVGNRDGFIDGMGVNAILSIGNTTVNAIANDGIAQKEGNSYIFYVNEEKINTDKEKEYLFKRIRIKKGASSLGYTEIIPIDVLPDSVKVATSGAVFIQAKMDGGNQHGH